MHDLSCAYSPTGFIYYLHSHIVMSFSEVFVHTIKRTFSLPIDVVTILVGHHRIKIFRTLLRKIKKKDLMFRYTHQETQRHYKKKKKKNW